MAETNAKGHKAVGKIKHKPGMMYYHSGGTIWERDPKEGKKKAKKK